MLESISIKQKLLIKKREDLLALCEKHGAHNVRVFGSVARGEDGPESDVDLVVDMEKDRSYFELVELNQEAESLMECSVDLIAEDELNLQLRDSILQSAVVL